MLTYLLKNYGSSKQGSKGAVVNNTNKKLIFRNCPSIY